MTMCSNIGGKRSVGLEMIDLGRTILDYRIKIVKYEKNPIEIKFLGPAEIGYLFYIDFFAIKKNNFRIGPYVRRGNEALSLTAADILSSIQEIAVDSVMDYTPSLDNLKGCGEIILPSGKTCNFIADNLSTYYPEDYNRFLEINKMTSNNELSSDCCFPIEFYKPVIITFPHSSPAV